MVFWIPPNFKYKRVEIIGRGRSSVVWRARDKKSNKLFALKVYRVDSSPFILERATNEVLLLDRVQNGVSRR